MSGFVRVVEVGPRDGLQNEKAIVPLEAKVSLVNELSAAGVSYIEAGSFVSPKWVPQMSNSDALFEMIDRNANTRYAALTPNLRGYEAAKICGAEEVAVFAAASEAFSQRNINCSIDESIQRFEELAKQANSDGVPIRGYVSCVFACPYGGKVDPRKVIETTRKLFDLGCYEVSLGDTIGVGTAYDTKQLLSLMSSEFDTSKLALHLHDTYGQALASVYAGLEAGIRCFDASVAGLGGCPYAKGATGNLATEDLVYLLHSGGFETGINLEKLASAGNKISDVLGREYQSSVGKALFKSC
ncbi:hydroxymethylglutaryl-CoA lyase [Oleiphilus sp. HI0066]|uniref:hydroxymethylglutaryl-CoA lyase n=1 Tax=Oleiphilus sp. HI0066 TaxID=1822242 RepID=UPI0007C2A716|nr:hydroxymethylglutaryl-CoA lyase [Oleiphilus sp. HI0066]KZY70764.1 hydroxymethylglutaryl-CoA lyase [Oleiphilus sp. HI0066]